MFIYLIRHGESVSREGLTHNEALSVGLSERGKKEAQGCARFFRRRTYEALYSSPASRSYETAEYIAQGSNHEIIIDERCSEYRASGGSLDGKAIKDIKKKRAIDFDYKVFDGESLNESVERFFEALTDYTLRHRGDVVVSCHALIIQNLLVKKFHQKPFPPIDHGSITVLAFEQGTLRLKYVNRVYHLPHGLLRTLRYSLKRYLNKGT